MAYWSQFIIKNFHPNSYSEDKIQIEQNTFTFLLGIVSAAIALPIVTLAIALSVFLPQGKWEEFWDKFLEV